MLTIPTCDLVDVCKGRGNLPLAPPAEMLLITQFQVGARLLTLYDCSCETHCGSTATSADPAGSRQCCCGKYPVFDATWLAVLAATAEELKSSGTWLRLQRAGMMSHFLRCCSVLQNDAQAQ